MAGFEQPVLKYVKPQKTTDGDFDFTEVDDMLSRDYVQGSVIQMVRNINPVGTSAQQVRLTDGTDLLNINSDGSLNVGTANSVAANATQANNNTQTIFTAGAGGARIYGIQLSAQGGNIAPVYIAINGVRSLQIIPSTQTSSCSSDFGNNYVELAAGQTVTVVSTVAGNYGSGSCYYKNL